jgi:hypothetical protein
MKRAILIALAAGVLGMLALGIAYSCAEEESYRQTIRDSKADHDALMGR